MCRQAAACKGAGIMDAARDMAETGAPDCTVVRAVRQTGGRGRQARPWVSEAGNLYITALLREQRPLSACAQLSFAAALALADTVDHPDVALKWPNDVLFSGKKIAGILLEGGGPTDAPWVLIGIGLNIAHHPVETPFPATDLVSEGVDRPLDALFRRVLQGIDHWRSIWHKEGASALHGPWIERAHDIPPIVLYGDVARSSIAAAKRRVPSARSDGFAFSSSL